MEKNQRFSFAILALSILLVPLAATSYAQQGDPGQGQAQGQESRQEQAQQRLDQMSKQLNLTDDQKTKIQTLMQDQAAQRQSLRQDTSLSRQDKMAKMRVINQSTRKEINQVLTPDQRKMWKQMTRNMRGRRGQQETPASGA